MRTGTLVIGAILLCGCYVPAPVGSAAPDIGSRVQVQLTDAGSVALANSIGRGVTGLDGTIVQRTDSNLTLSVKHTDLASGDQQPWSGENVALPTSAIASVRQKKLSVWRSGALASALLGAALAIKFGGPGSSTGSTDVGTKNTK